jgi:adenylate kinase family enzyme
MRRIIVIGIPGAGKSTFARRLGDKLNLPVYHLDRYFWSPGWKASSPEAFDETLGELMA